MKVIKNVPLVPLAVLSLIICFSLPGFSAEPKKKSTMSTSMNPETKADMADMYSKMSECMKTDKSMEQCQKDVMKDCAVMKKTGHCPLMDGMKPMMKKGMMHDKMKGMEMEKPVSEQLADFF